MRKISMKRKSKAANSEVPEDDRSGDEASSTEQDPDDSTNDSSTKRKRSNKGKKTNKANEANGTDKKKAKKDVEEENDDEEEDEEEYEVEKVVGDKMIKGVRHYLIRWKGHGEKDDTWEPATTVNCDELIQEYLDSKGKSPSKKGKSNTKDKKKKSKPTHDDNSDDSEEEKTEVYEVDKILEVHFKRDGKREFLVHWKGYPSADNTWEPEEHMNCEDLIEKFMKKVDNAKSLDSKELRVSRKPTDRYTVSTPDSGRKLSRRNKGKAQVHYYDGE